MTELRDNNEKYDNFVAPLMDLDIKFIFTILFLTTAVIIMIIIIIVVIAPFDHPQSLSLFQRIRHIWDNDDKDKENRVLDSFLKGSHLHKYHKRKHKKNRYHDKKYTNSTASSYFCWNEFQEHMVVRWIPSFLKKDGWFLSNNTHSNNVGSNNESNNQDRIYIGMDCEMVGAGRHGVESLLARCTLVTMDHENKVQVLYDEYVKPSKPVTDYRTQYSGITPHHLSFCAKVTVDQCRMQVINILSNNQANKKAILVGHGLENDFQVLKFQYPQELIRDTATYRPLMRQVRKRYYPQKLSFLTKEYLNLAIQASQHDSIEDAVAALQVYNYFSSEWEASLTNKTSSHRLFRQSHDELKYTLYIDGCNIPMGLRRCEHYTTNAEKNPDADEWFQWKCTNSSCSSTWRLLSKGDGEQRTKQKQNNKDHFDWIPFFRSMLSSSSATKQQNAFLYSFEKILIAWDGASLTKHNIHKSLHGEISPGLHLHITERNMEVDDWIIKDIQNRKQNHIKTYDPFIQIISIDRILQLLSEPQNHDGERYYIVVRRSGGGTKTNKALFDKLHLRRPNEGALCLVPGLFKSSRFQKNCIQIARDLQRVTSKSKQGSKGILQFELHRIIPSITSIVVTDDVLLADRVVQDDSIVLSYWQFQHLF